MKLFNNIYSYRELLKTSVQKDIRGKYKGAWLGIFWSLLNPLLLLTVYSIIFPYILKINIENYTMYLCVALLPWTSFTSTVTTGTFSVVTNGNILKKVYFPREIIPISVVLSGMINFIISSIVIFVFLMFCGIGISLYVLLFPFIIMLQSLITLAIVFITSSCMVYVRDLEHFVSLGLMVLFYGTPIVYTMDSIPASLKWILSLNPMTHVIEAYRDILYYQRFPDFSNLFMLFVITIICVIIGYTIFNKLQRNFAEEL